MSRPRKDETEQEAARAFYALQRAIVLYARESSPERVRPREAEIAELRAAYDAAIARGGRSSAAAAAAITEAHEAGAQAERARIAERAEVAARAALATTSTDTGEEEAAAIEAACDAYLAALLETAEAVASG